MATINPSLSRYKVSEFKLNTLLEITNAINNNLPEDQLFILFQYILEHQLNIGRAVGYLLRDEAWSCMLQYGATEEELLINVEEDLAHIKDITVVAMLGESSSTANFDVVIPVFHQSQIIAYILLGDLDEQELKASPIIKHLPFIQTLANITAVAVENKRLMRESQEQEKMKHELETASEMQSMLLPRELPNDNDFQIAGYYRPHQEVGGDFYDIKMINENELMICLADVSGKGISAAILMASFQANLRAQFEVENDLEIILNNLNKNVWKNASGERFITAFLAKYNRETRELQYANCAHPAPILLDANSILRLEKGSVGLGMFEEIPFINLGTMKIAQNSMLVSFTDGVNELESMDGTPFDDDMVIEIMKGEEYSNMSEFNMLLMNALKRHKGKLDYHDDIAIVAARFF
jgi:sigma-B regulation protein RsbU (phosphoserine phosphatase)